MQTLTALDVLAGLKAADLNQSQERPVLERNTTNAVGDNFTTEAGSPPTPLGQLNQQQVPTEPSPLEEKKSKHTVYSSGQQQRTTLNVLAVQAAATAGAATAAAQQRVAPPRAAAPPAQQPPTTRQHPIIANAMSAVEEHAPWLREIPSVPVYHPTAEEWKDPLAYIRSIQPEAGKFGACVVKAPITPAVPAALLLKDLRFTTRLQKVKDDPWGKTWEEGIKFYDSGRKCTLLEYAKFADEFARRKLGLAAELPTATVESMYWREKELTRVGKVLTVEYGNDIEGSAFHPQDPLGQTKWNLNSFSDLPGSALRHCISPAPGVTTPMLYIGMLYATFAWHVEDHFMYSINYSHAGASKVWYCVPASAADDVETTAAETVYRDPCTTMIEEQGASLQACNEAVAEALAGKTTSMSPRYLVKKGIPVYRAVQEAGSYVITFPRSYHSGFSTGFNLGEAVNFTLSDWWPFGEHARRLYRSFNRQQIISHEQVLCDEASALAAKLDTLGSMRHLSGEDRPVAIAFVAMMQKLHRLRENFQAKKISQVATCSPDVEPTAAEMRNSIPCKRCSHHSYLVSAVADARKVQNEWQHLCLECAAAAAAEEDDDDDDRVGAAGAESSLSSHVMVYVKPLWYKMENISKLFTYLLANQQPAQHVEEEELANTAAVVVHQTLSLDGISEKAIEDLDVLYRYNWTKLDEPLVDAPSWVAKQPETTIIPPAVGRAAGADVDGEFSLHARKRSLEDADHDDEPKTTLPQREHHQQQMDKDAEEEAAEEKQITTTTLGRAPRISLASMKNKEISFHYTASASSLPTLEATFVRNDAIKLPGIEKPVDRRVYRLNSTGEMVIFGSDVVRVVCRSQAKSGGMSRFLARILYIATNNDASAPDKHLVYITGVRNRRSPAIGRSGAAVLLESEMMRERDDYGVLSAMLHGVWENVEDTSVPEKEEEEEKGVEVQVIPAPAGTTILPQPASLKKKRGSAGPETKKNTSSKRQKVAVVEEESPQAHPEPRVFFQNAEPVALLLQPPPKAPSPPPPAELPFPQPYISLPRDNPSESPPQEQQPQPNNAAETTVLQEVQHADKLIIDKITVAEASNNTGVPELGVVNDKKFTAFPSLFNGDKDSASLALSQRAFPTALNATISAAEDPEEIEVEIEAENNRTCGEDSDGIGARGNASDEKKAASPASTNAPSPSAAPSPQTEITVEELPPLEEDVLALMEAQFSQDVAAAAAAAAIASHQQMQAPPPPAAAVAPTPYYASHTLAQPEYTNVYTSLDPILINEPPQQQQQQQQHSYQQLHHQRLMEHSAAAQAPAPLFSLFHHRQVLLGGNNWNATGNLDGNQHVDMNLQNHHHMGIRPLYVPPPSGGAGGGAGGGGGDGGRSSTAGWNCNTGEMRRW